MKSVSIEAPEIHILGTQLNDALLGRHLTRIDVDDVARLQRLGFVNDDLTTFTQLVDQTVTDVRWRGAGIIIDIGADHHLVIAPEYGGRVRLCSPGDDLPPSRHLTATLDVGTTLVVRLTGMGGLQAWPGDQLDRSYSYTRDFVRGLDPLDLDRDTFTTAIAPRSRSLKAALVGKDAVVVGLGNASFQDIAFRARMHPTRHLEQLDSTGRDALYNALTDLMDDRLSADGKEGFEDLYGRPGGYRTPMASGLAGTGCPNCGSTIVKIRHGGGEVGFCPTCQT